MNPCTAQKLIESRDQMLLWLLKLKNITHNLLIAINQLSKMFLKGTNSFIVKENEFNHQKFLFISKKQIYILYT